MHNFGSRNWTTDERTIPAALGEAESPQKWINGVPPKPLPLPILVGKRACIQFGEPLPDPTVPPVEENTCDAYPSACYGRPQRQIAAYDITCCGTQLGFAKVTYESYIDVNAARISLAEFLGEGFLFFTVPNSGSTVPGSIIAVGKVCVVVLPGTTNFQQLALQLLYGSSGPINVGPFSTNPQFLAAAQAIEQRMTLAGAGVCNEYYFVGHSYGGAIATILAARMALNRPSALVNLMTFGAPPSGDARLRELISETRQRNFVIEEDPVPGLPPRLDNLWWLSGVLGAFLVSQWNSLAPPGNRILIGEYGEQIESDDDFLADGLTETIAKLIAAALATPAFFSHVMQNYYRRLNNGCGIVKHGEYTYAISVEGITAIDPFSVVHDLSGSAVAFVADDFSWAGVSDNFDFSFELTWQESYPNGAGFLLQERFFYPPGNFVDLYWILPDAPYQLGSIWAVDPVIQPGWTILTPGVVTISFVPAPLGADVNPHDIFP